MARRRNGYVIARTLTATTAGTTSPTRLAQSVEQQLPEYGRPNEPTATSLSGSIRPTWEVYPGE